ncbi:hypothetical protein IW147_004977 [Coemansia sp. RSA 720]|nr:hypothetical protein IW147_004977 [Coemansia sp. RSA 720]
MFCVRTLCARVRSSTRAFTQKTARAPTAAFCVIGDEILSGKTQDTNTRTLASQCFSLGINLQKIDIVPDSQAAISASLTQLSHEHSVVFTSGGIGPTHDDITYDAVAHAFGDELAYHSATLDRMQRIMGDKVRARPDPNGTSAERACARMALFPRSAHVTFVDSELWVPVVRVRNVHVLPGIPRLFARMAAAYLPALAQQLGVSAFVRAEVATHVSESVLAPVLERVQIEYAPWNIKLGSYPQWTSPPHNIVSVVGQSPGHVHACRDKLARLLADIT